MAKVKIQTAYDQRPDATGPIEIVLPFLPPSTNNLYVNMPGKGRVRSAEYRKWVTQMGLLLNSQCKSRMPGRVDLKFILEDKHPTRDASNNLKSLEDLLVSIGILRDDRAAYVRSVSATWADIEGVRIEIWAAPARQSDRRAA